MTTSTREPHPRADVEAALKKWEAAIRAADDHREQQARKRNTPEIDKRERELDEAFDRSEAIVAADPFFGPLLALHGYERYHDPDGTPAEIKSYIVWQHMSELENLKEGEGYDLEYVVKLLEIDVNVRAFVKRFVDHYAKNEPFVKEMFKSAGSNICDLSSVFNQYLAVLDERAEAA